MLAFACEALQDMDSRILIAADGQTLGSVVLDVLAHDATLQRVSL